MPELDPLMRDALAWVVRLRSGEATKADLAALQAWRDQSEDHDEAFKQAALLWKDLRAASEVIKEERKGQPYAFRSRQPQWMASRRAVLGGAIAASAAAYMVVQPPLGLWPSFSELTADYRTGKGEQRDLSLAQGISVRLNTQTSMTLRRSEQGESQAELISGEAAITAKRSPDRPFILLAGSGRIMTAQAMFNTRCIDGVVSVTCAEGEVEVEHAQSVVRIRQEQRVNYSSAEGLIGPVVGDVVQATAWRQGLLIFRDRPLAEVVEEVNRYRHGRIVVTNAVLGQRMVNGTFHLHRLDDFIGQVRQLFGANVRSLPGGVVLLS